MNDIALELAKLHILEGADFVRQLRRIVTFREFKFVEDGIFSAIDEYNEDYNSLLTRIAG